MKKIIWILFLLGSVVVCIAQPGYPVNLRNVIIGYQTTPEGLFFRGSHSPTHIPLEKYGTFMYVDTLTRQIWMYLDKDTVNSQPVGVWAKMYPSVSDLASLTDVNTTGKIQSSMLIYDAGTSKWIIDNGTVYRKTTDALSGEVYGAYNDTKLGTVSALSLNTTPPATLSVGMLSWDASTGTASLGLLGGNVQLKVGQQLVKRVVNKTTTNVNLLRSEYKVVKLLGASGSRISVDLAQANNEAGSAGTLGVVIEDINNNQQGFILVAGEITNINTTGALVGESWSEGDALYLSATTPGALTKVKPTPPNHTVIVGWVESVNATNGKIYVKIDNGYELEEIHNVLTTGKTNGSILYYDNGLWKASTGITLDNTGTLALNAVTDNTLMYVDGDKKLRSVTLTTTGSSGEATFTNGTLNIPQYAGSTNLSTSQSGSNVNLNSSTGSDITLIPGGGTTLTSGGSGTNVTVSSSNIYTSNGSIPDNTNRTITIPETSSLQLTSATVIGKASQHKPGVSVFNTTDNTLQVTSGELYQTSNSNLDAQISLRGGRVDVFGNSGVDANPQVAGLSVTETNKVVVTQSSSDAATTVMAKAANNELKSLTPLETRTFILPGQGTHANKYLKTNGTDVSWETVTAGVSNVIASTPLSSTGGANPEISIQQATTGQSGFLSSADWNTFNSKQNTISLTTNGISGAATLNGTTLNIPQYTGGAGTVTSVTASGTAGNPISITNTTTTPTIELLSATSNRNGYLTSSDWATFNSKQNALTDPVTGTGAANKVAFWTNNNTLSSNNNFHWDNANGKLGIGTATIDSTLTVAGGISLTGGVSSVTGVNVSNGQSGFSFLPQVTIPNERSALGLTHTATSAADSPGGIVGLAITAQTPNTNFTYGASNGINAMRVRGFHAASTTLSVLNGVNFTVRNIGNGTVTNAVGGNFVMGNAGGTTGTGTITTGTGGSYSLENSSLGTINTLRGINVQCGNSGGINSIQNFYGFHLTALTGTSGGFNTVYGLYIPPSWSTPATIKYGIYTADEGAINYIAGNTYMGATYSAPQARLHVAGSARINNTLTLSDNPPAIASNPNQVLLRNTSSGDVSSLIGNTVNQVLKWDGSKWYAGADEGGGSSSGLTSLNGLTPSTQTFTQGAGISINSSASTHTFALTGQALAFHNLATNGIVAKTGSGSAAVRTITGTSPITVTNGDGVGGNPTIGLNTVAIANGGTGATTQQSALNALAGGVTNAQFLRGNGSNVIMSAIQVGDVPTLNQNTTGSAGSAAILTTGRTIQTNLGLTTAASFNGSIDVTPGVTGVLSVANGGTGLSSYAIGDLIQATGATTLSRLASVSTGNVLLSGGANTVSSWGKVGLTTHVTGTLPVSNGGTNTATAPTAGQTLIATNTTTYTPITPSTYTGSNANPIVWNVNYRSSGIYRISNTATATITGVTVSNVVAGGVYAFHISEASNTVTITVPWPITTFKNLALSDYGTRVYTTPTIITCYYDGASFVCE